MTTHLIAELCQNHLGDEELLLSMVDVLASAKVKYAKIQSFFASDLSDSWVNESGRLSKLELSWDTHKKFIAHCAANNIVPITSIYSAKYIPNLMECGFGWIKLGSAQALDTALINDVWEAGFNLIVSTGGTHMCDLPKLPDPKAGQSLVVMHCVSKYPHQWTESNLFRLLDLHQKYPHANLGFSDHTDPTMPNWDVPSKLACSMGVGFIERHFTVLSRELTKDGPVSIDPEQLLALQRHLSLTRAEQTEIMDKEGFGVLLKKPDRKEMALIERYRTRWADAV